MMSDVSQKLGASLDTSHNDVILDLKFNHYGTKIASSSADHTIKIWELGKDGQWKQTAEWKAHDGPISRIDWAPVEYGDILASASQDRTVIIWERSSARNGPGGLAKWINRAKLVDSRQAVNDIAFAPKHLGLQVATCSADGMVRLYECVDVMNLMHWPLVDEFEVGGSVGALCIAWSRNRFMLPAMVVGSDKRMQIWRQLDGRKWTLSDVASEHAHESAVNGVAWAPNLGRSYEFLASASQDRTVRIYKLQGDTLEQVACFRDHKSEVWHVEFNVTGTVLASSGDDGVVRLWTRDLTAANQNTWIALNTIASEE